MRLERLTPAHVKQAVAIYLDHAWPDGPLGKSRAAADSVSASSTLKELRTAFEATSEPGPNPVEAEGEARNKEEQCRRYALRLGNHRYPWMKFVIQEYLVGGEFFFSVDTHDELRIEPDSPDYAGWLELQAFNRDLKRVIEALSLIHI